MSDTPDTTAPPPSRTGRVVRWVFGGIAALVLLVLLVVGLWAAWPGSLAQAIGWGQSYMAKLGPSAGTLDVAEVQGSLLRGGQIGRLQWQRDGLSVVTTDTRIGLSSWFWADALLGRGVRLSQFDIARLEIDDQRPPTPSAPPEPLQPITLPLPVTLPWSIGELVLAGEQPLTFSGLKGQYRYRPADSVWNLGVADAHQFDLDNLLVAGGRYQAKAVLGAQAPMPLRVDASGEVQTTVPGGGERVTLQATAKITGTLATTDAALDASASLKASGAVAPPDAPTLDAQARLRPWWPQPVESVDATMNRIDLAAFWPQAPVTLLSGTVKAQPEGEAWRARLNLANAASGPADRQRLPVDRLEAELEQRSARWTLSRLDAQLGGGRLQGQGQWAPASGAQASALGEWQGDVKASRINPAQLWSSIAPAALDGTATARTVDADTQRAAIDIAARVQPSGTQPRASALAGLRLRELDLKGRWRPSTDNAAQGVLELRQARLSAADATLDGQGTLDTLERSFDGQVALQLPGAQAQWKGKTAHAHGSGDLDLNLDDTSRVLAWVRSLQTLPFVGPQIRTALDGQPGLQAEGSARLAADWQGGLGVFGYPAPATGAGNATPPRLQVGLDAPRLRIAREVATGNPVSPSATQAVNLSALKLQASGPPERLALSLAGQAEQGPWRATLDTQGLLQLGAARRPDIDTGRLELSQLKLQATDSARPDRTVEWTLESVASLGLQWQGARSGALQVQADPGQLRLQPVFRRRAAPAAAPAVAVSAATVAAAAATPTVTTPMTLAWERITWNAGALDTRGQLSNLPLSWVDALATPEGARHGPLSESGLGGDVVFDGAWDLSLPADAVAPPRLTAQLQRRSGDLSVQTDGAFDENTRSTQRLQTGIREARLNLETQGSTVLARLRWDSERLGQASADLSTTLSPPNADQAAWHWPEQAALRGTVKASLPQMGVWSALAPPGWRVRGSLGADLTLSGTRDKPLFNGSLNADDLALRSLVNGISFSRGQLRATLAGERITIERFYLQGRGGAENGGTLLATGSTEWRTVTVDGQPRRQPYISLNATATRLRVSTRADRLLTLSGQLQAELAGTALQLRGKLTADEALFVLPDESTPSLGDDVVVRGTEIPLEDPNAFRVQPDVLVDLNLGDNFEVRGQGLQTRLSGELNVRSTPASPTPRVLGEVRTVRGTYRAYGQRLTIETGLLRFNGPYDNPTLDITAVRPNTTQRVGVLISGTAQLPRVRLFSDPELPDSEKLAWLVLGRPASGAGAEAAVLQQAALALIARGGGGLDGGLAGAFGLDELSFAGSATNADGTTSAAALTLGKRLSNKLYLTYESSLAGAMGTVSMFYDLSRRVTVRARAGEENAIDLIFTTQFD
jgi:translocation and assembly module TamB